MGKQQNIKQPTTKVAEVTTKGQTQQTSDSHDDGMLNEAKVDQIRDIIFGSQMRAYEGRFNQLDERLSAEIVRLRDDMSERLDKLESFIKDEFNRANEQVNQEKNNRIKAIEALQQEVATTDKKCNQRMSDLTEQLAKENAELRQMLHEQVSDVLDKLSRSETQLSDQLNRQSIQLTNSKVARADLADLFSEVSLRLNAQFDLSDAVTEE